MTKTQVWAEALKLLEAHKGSKKLTMALEELLAPKAGGGSSVNPPKLDEDGNIVEAWCRWHERYEPVENMVISNGKSKGYCKAAISKWNKANSQIKKYEAQASSALLSGDFEQAQEFAGKAKELKELFNLPSYYDFDEDWSVFND